MRRTPLQRLKALAAEDLRVLARRERWMRVRRAWERLAAWEKGLSQKVKTLTGLAATAGALYGTMRRPVGWLADLYRARSVGQAELPKTGVASTAQDYVKDPRSNNRGTTQRR